MKQKLMLLMILLLFLFGCSGGTNTGGGTETGDPGADIQPNSGLVGGATTLDVDGNIVVSNVAVWIDQKVSKTTYTSDGGEYMFTNVPAGKHRVYAYWRYQDTVLVGQSEEFEIASKGGSLKPFVYLGQNILLTPAATLFGQLPFLKNINFKNVKIRLKDSHFETFASSDGRFELSAIPEGSYQLEILSGTKVLTRFSFEVFSDEEFDLSEIIKANL